MPQLFSHWQAFYLCFTSRELYRDVYLRWQGMGFRYLMWLNVLLITPVVVLLMIQIDRGVFQEDGSLTPELQSIAQQIISQLPPMTWEDGVMQTDAPQPYEIRATIRDESFLFAVIDLDASAQALLANDAIFLFTADAVHIDQGNNQDVETRYWKEFGTEYFRLDQAVAQFYLEDATQWTYENRLWLYLTFGMLSWVGTVLIMVLYRILQALLFGGAGLMIASFFQFELRYEEAVRLACIALTPAVLFDVILSFTIGDGLSFWLFVLATLGYLAYAIHSNRHPEGGARHGG